MSPLTPNQFMIAAIAVAGVLLVILILLVTRIA